MSHVCFGLIVYRFLKAFKWAYVFLFRRGKKLGPLQKEKKIMILKNSTTKIIIKIKNKILDNIKKLINYRNNYI